jgi:hypothetical protein
VNRSTELWMGIISKENGKYRRASVDSRAREGERQAAAAQAIRGFDVERSTMKINTTLFSVSMLVMALLASMVILKSATAADDDTVAAITKLENDSVKADLASDKSYPEKVLAADWTGGDSSGKWFTKQAVLKMMGDPKNNKTNSENISELKVRAYGSTAIATYKDTYDAMVQGEHRSRTVITTDTFVKRGDLWKLVASHSSETK